MHKQVVGMKRKGEDHGDDVFMTEEDARQYYEHVQNASARRYVELLKKVKQLDVKGQYLDVGSGPGYVTGMIARQQPEARITGVDISAEMVKIANEVIEDDLRERINFVVGDACNENTLTGLEKYDLIFSTFTMHHWPDAAKAIRNLHAILNEKGIIYIYDLKRVWWLYYIRSEKGFYKSIRASYTAREIDKMMLEIGISNYSVKTVTPFFMQNLLIYK